MPTPAYKIDKSTRPLSTSEPLTNNYNDSVGLVDFYSPSESKYDIPFNEYVNYRKKKLKSIAPIPQNPRALIELGDFHVARGKVKHAIKPYSNAIKVDEKSVEAYRKLIPILVNTDKTDLASNYFKQLLDITDNHPSVLNDYFIFRLATSKSHDDITDVKKLIKEAVKTHSKDARFYVTLGLVYLVHTLDFEEAENNFRQAIKLDSSNIDAVNNIGICFQRRKQYKKALKQYLAAIELDEYYLPAYENIASNAAAQDDYKSAIEILEQAKRLNLKLADNWDHTYGWFLIKLLQFDKAKIWYENKIREEPDNSFLYNNLGVCLERLGKIEKAKDNYVRSVDIYLQKLRQNPAAHDERAADAFLNACRHVQRAGEFRLLEQIAKNMLNTGLIPAAAYYYLGSSSIQLKKYVVAEKYLNDSLAIDDTVVDPYIDLGYFYDMISLRYDKAIELIEKGISKGFDDPLLFNNLAYAYLKIGEVAKAKSILNRDLNDPSFKATKGLLALYEDNLKLANKQYKSAIESLPTGKQDEATQVWMYELAAHWLRKDDAKKAYEVVIDAKKLLKDSVIFPQLISLEKEIKSSLD